MSIHERFIFTLAEKLGMTAARVKAEMGIREYLKWIEFESWRVEQSKRKPHEIDLEEADDASILKGFGLG